MLVEVLLILINFKLSICSNQVIVIVLYGPFTHIRANQYRSVWSMRAQWYFTLYCCFELICVKDRFFVYQCYLLQLVFSTRCNSSNLRFITPPRNILVFENTSWNLLRINSKIFESRTGPLNCARKPNR